MIFTSEHPELEQSLHTDMFHIKPCESDWSFILTVIVRGHVAITLTS